MTGENKRMTLGSTKTILFASLTVAMILPFSSANMAESEQTVEDSAKPYEFDEIMNAITKADPHVREFSKMLIFDITSAKDTMSDKEILIINDFVEMHNQYIVDIKTDPDSYHEYDPELEAKFAELRKQIQKSLTEVDHVSNLVLPEAFAVFGEEVCGGGYDNHHVEYQMKKVKEESSRDDAISTLEDHDYDPVPNYALYPGAQTRIDAGELIDYAKRLSVYGCNEGAFRTEAVATVGGTWDIWISKNEPNPDVLSYSSPVWWWTFYVHTWHGTIHDDDKLNKTWSPRL